MKKDDLKPYIRISEDAVAKIAQLSALEIKGVSKAEKKSVSIRNLGGIVEIAISIFVNTSEDAQAVAEKVQYAIKESVQNMTGIPVSRVCVGVLGAE